MKTATTQILITALCFCFIGLSNLNAQRLLKEISLKQQIENSSLVVEGEVVSKKSFWRDNLIYTANTIEVYKVFKGELLKSIDVVTVGGAVDDKVLLVSSSLKLQKGNVGVFMLQHDAKNNSFVNKSSNKQFKPFGAIQGFYKYNTYDDVAINPFNKKQGISSIFYKEIMSITNKAFVEISINKVLESSKSSTANKSLAPSITSFNPTTATAGTKTELTINGSGFGSSGKIGFSDADEGGSAYVDALDTQIVSWSDSQIVVEIPSAAGTGTIRVTDDATPTPSSIVSSTNLTILYSELNYEYDPGSGLQAYPIQHYGKSTNGGYEWSMQTDFFNDTEHSGAKAAFERALETWRCHTKINWTISTASTSIDVVASEGINVIRFDNDSELEAGVLGACYTWAARYTGCISGASVQFFVEELDVVFDDDTIWYFGTGLPEVQYDFESVALHELGHGHQLGHVINTNAVMHYDLAPAEYNRVLSSNDIDAASDIQGRSNSTSVCGVLDLMIDYSGTCSLSVEDEELNNAISVYPNPSSGQIYIKNESYISLQKVVIYDVSGRLIFNMNISDTSRIKAISLTGISKGMYFVNIHSENAMITKKIVFE